MHIKSFTALLPPPYQGEIGSILRSELRVFSRKHVLCLVRKFSSLELLVAIPYLNSVQGLKKLFQVMCLIIHHEAHR